MAVNMPGGVFYLKKYGMEILMACLLLVSFFFLSREAAQVAGTMSSNTGNKKYQSENLRTILVDVGHGGADPGMIGVGGLEEKGINLEIALKVRDVLEKKGFTVIMTREQDEGLYDQDSRNQKAQDMQRRIALIRECKPVLCVSIHQNSYQDSAVYGPQVFYYEDSLQGKKMAELIQTELNTRLEVKRPREAKGNKTYYLLKRSESVLNIVECGFLTNPQEAELLQTEEYQQKVAEAVAEGICTYLEQQDIK